MSCIQESNQIIEQAKQQRAEVIGSALQAHALPVAIVAALSFALFQFVSTFPTERPAQVQTAQLG